MKPKARDYVLSHGFSLALCLGSFSLLYCPTVQYIAPDDVDIYFGNRALYFLHRIPNFLSACAHGHWPGSVEFPMAFHHGPGEIYVAMPFVFFLGHTPAAIYWRKAFFAFLGLVATYGLSWTLYRNRWIAFLTSLLLAASPSYAIMSMKGMWMGTSVVAFSAGCLYFLLEYLDQRQPWLICHGFICAGLGLASRDTMVAFILGLIAFLAFYGRGTIALLPRRPEKRGLSAAASILAVLILIALMLAAPFRPESGIPSLLELGQRWNPFNDGNKLDYWNSLSIRFGQLKDLSRGVGHLAMFVDDPDPFAHIIRGQWFLVLAILGAGIWSASLLASGRTMSKRLVLPWVIMLVYLLASPLTLTRLRPSHLLPLLPFIYLAACSSIALAGKTRLRAWIVAALLLFSSYRVWAGVLFMNALRAELRRTGGSEPRMFRAAIDLFQWFSRRPGRTPVIFGGWGEMLRYYSGGKITPETVWPDPNHLSQTFQNEGDRLFQLNGACFVFDTFPEYGATPPFEAFLRETARRKLKVSLIDTIKGPRGEPAFLIYEVVP